MRERISYEGKRAVDDALKLAGGTNAAADAWCNLSGDRPPPPPDASKANGFKQMALPGTER